MKPKFGGIWGCGRELRGQKSGLNEKTAAGSEEWGFRQRGNGLEEVLEDRRVVRNGWVAATGAIMGREFAEFRPLVLGGGGGIGKGTKSIGLSGPGLRADEWYINPPIPRWC